MANQVLDALRAKFSAAIEKTESMYGDEVAWIKKDQLVAVATWLRDDPAMAFDSPVFVTAIDRLDWRPVGTTGVPLPSAAGGPSPHWTEDQPRFEVCFQLRSSRHRYRIRLKVAILEQDGHCPSLAPLWPAFDWQERETFDMYGIRFDGHPDLRRIYLSEEFVGYPQRKDDPKEKRQPLVRRDDLPINPIKKDAR
jgi:NADH-quinone oxidoreductase subunit C